MCLCVRCHGLGLMGLGLMVSGLVFLFFLLLRPLEASGVYVSRGCLALCVEHRGLAPRYHGTTVPPIELLV